MELDRYTSIRSIIETPVLDPKKWAKLPGIPADAILIDMEDAVPATRKDEGRAAVIAALANPAGYGHRLAIARPNHLTTPWGRDDIIALAQAGVEVMLYPKVRSVGDVREVQRLLRDHGADPDLLLCIETPQAVAEVEALTALEKVVGVCFGEGDLSADLGITIFRPDGSVNPTLVQARTRTILAAHAAGIASFEAAFQRDIRDLDETRQRCEELVGLGATGLMAIYPPHVNVHLAVFTPTPEEVAAAESVVAAMQATIEAGNPAVQLEDGRTLLIHDYLKAQRIIARSQREPSEAVA